MFIERIGWLDPWRLAVWTYQQRATLPRVLIDAEHEDDAMKSGVLRLAIGKARQIAETKGFVLTRAEIALLAAGGRRQWERDEDSGIIVHVGIVCSPAAALFAGNEVVTLIPGQIIAFGARLWRSAANEGDSPQYDLVLRFVKEAVAPS